MQGMAKRSQARKSTAIVIARPAPHHATPRPIVIRQTKIQKTKGKHRKGRGGFGEKDRAMAIAGGFLLGFIDKSGFNVPTLPFLGKAGTIGVAAWAAGRYLKSKTAEDMATGMLAIAAYELGKEGKIDGAEDGDYIAGGI